MKLLNNSAGLSFFPSLFISVFLVSLVVLGTSCSGGSSNNNNNNNNTPDLTPVPIATPPPPDPLVSAQTNFKDKVWTPFFTHDRCNNCHDFAALNATIFAGHPAPPYTDGNAAACIGCHSQALLGFTGWVQVPGPDKWNKLTDSNTVRAHIMEPGLHSGVNLFKHLLGEGVDKAPLVQWAFFNGPDTGPGAGQVHPGAVPGGGGPIPPAELLDWNLFKLAVQEWMCLEKKVPGAPDLGLPATVVCP